MYTLGMLNDIYNSLFPTATQDDPPRALIYSNSQCWAQAHILSKILDSYHIHNLNESKPLSPLLYNIILIPLPATKTRH